jgi:hypothetical protein
MRRSVTQRAYSVNDPKSLHGPPPVDRSGSQVAVALTKDALWIAVLLSSLALWAAVWAAAASLASAWLQ